jgi:chromate transporter
MIKPSYKELIFIWTKIGAMSFGGPAAQILLMFNEIVERRKWLEERAFNSALSFCMLLPGPEAMQLATYLGWRTHGVLGGLVAGLLFVLPGAFVVGILSVIYIYYGTNYYMKSVFLGIQSAVVIIIIDALVKLAKRSVNSLSKTATATVTFILLYCYQAPFALVILGVGLTAYIFSKEKLQSDPTITEQIGHKAIWITGGTWLGIWLLPLIVLSILFFDSIFVELAWLFSKLAVLSFGGAYAVLAYMSQTVVVDNQWLTPEMMMDGLGLAETTPGPLILVTEFVGIVSAALSNEEISITRGLLGGSVALWATFAPCFLWIFLGAPYVDWITQQPKLEYTLSMVSAAVTGVILNLFFWFSTHIFFSETLVSSILGSTTTLPRLQSVQFAPIIISLVALSVRKKLGVFGTILLCATIPLIFELSPHIFAR